MSQIGKIRKKISECFKLCQNCYACEVVGQPAVRKRGWANCVPELRVSAVMERMSSDLQLSTVIVVGTGTFECVQVGAKETMIYEENSCVLCE